MITLNEIAYNIKNLAYGGKNSTENNIGLDQIKHWIHYHRAKLVADNIDKGITNNQALYQPMDLTLRNTTNYTCQKWYSYLDNVDIAGISPIATTLSEALIQNIPRKSLDSGNAPHLVHRPTGDWIALSSLSADTTGDSQSHQDQFNRNQYGDEIASTQIKGDFRNLGHHSFFTPRSLQLKNDEGIKNVSVQRYVFTPDDLDTAYNNEQVKSYMYNSIKLYRKEGGDREYFDAYNKFTDNNKPYYTQETASHNIEDLLVTYGDTTDYGPGLVETSWLKYLHSPHRNILTFNKLQVTPNYHRGLNTSGFKKIFWAYRGKAEMILEDPTKIEMMWSPVNTIVNSSASTSNTAKVNWDDSKTPYPIPMEYVSDLIQRVIQVEMQTELKTQADEITDGLDDNLRRRGAQVQR